MPVAAAGQVLEFCGRMQMYVPDQFGGKWLLDVAFDVKRLPAWGSLRDNETPANIERQSKASITEPCDRDLRFDDGRAANGGDDRTDFVVSIMRVIDRFATPESHEITDAALAGDRGPKETKPQLFCSVLLSRLILGLEARAMIG